MPNYILVASNYFKNVIKTLANLACVSTYMLNSLPNVNFIFNIIIAGSVFTMIIFLLFVGLFVFVLFNLIHFGLLLSYWLLCCDVTHF